MINQVPLITNDLEINNLAHQPISINENIGTTIEEARDSTQMVRMERNKGLDFFFCTYKGCSYKSYLTAIVKRHIKVVHEKIKDFQCTSCDYVTGDKGNLKRHMKSRHDVLFGLPHL